MYLLGLAIQTWKLFNAICWFYSRNVAASGVTSRESTGFIDLGASTVKGILGPFADQMRNLSPEKLPQELRYVSLFVFVFVFFLKIFGRHLSFFVEPLIPLFWNSGDVCPGFKHQVGFPHLYALLPLYNGLLRFTSGVTPADLLVASMAAEPFQSTYLRTSIGGLKRAAASQHATKYVQPTDLCQLGLSW